jgi:hypothetical protein
LIESQVPFDGVKTSGLGSGSNGATTKELFTDIKSIYIKYGQSVTPAANAER